jgi:hypothetical protein
MTDEALREAIVAELESKVRPLIHMDRLHEGGYDCCGCSTYDEILDHAIRIVRDQ